MNILFYLVLGSIAVLGVAALLLIFWDRFHLSRKKSQYFIDKSVKQKPAESTEEEWQDNVRVSSKTFSMVDTPGTSELNELSFDALDDLLVTTDDPVKVATTAPKSIQKKSAAPSELIILYVMASPDQPFVGYELLQTLLALGLRYGEMNIFHYHQQTREGEGSPLFSLASAVEPGIFDLGNVGAIACPGLSLFMTAVIDDRFKAFEVMLETAEQLAQDLNGVVCDMQRVPLTEAKIAEYRNKIHAANIAAFENSF